MGFLGSNISGTFLGSSFLGSDQTNCLENRHFLMKMASFWPLYRCFRHQKGRYRVVWALAIPFPEPAAFYLFQM